MRELRDVISEVRETSTFEPDSEYAATEHWSGVARLLADELEFLLDRVETAEQAIARVRELHTLAERWVPANEEKPWLGFNRDGDKCERCNQVYPCPTINALEGDE